MTVKPAPSEVSAYAAGAVAGAAAMLLVLLPHLAIDVAATPARVSSTQAEGLKSPARGQSLYAAAKVGLPSSD